MLPSNHRGNGSLVPLLGTTALQHVDCYGNNDDDDDYRNCYDEGQGG